MKVLAKIFGVVALISVVAGCASDNVYVPRIPPEAQAKLLDYYEQPDNKVFVIAIDPGGDYAYGYDFGKATLKEAAKVAVEKCDASREASAIIARPYIYAINDKVVFKEMIMKDAQAKKDAKSNMDSGEQAQVDEVARQEATGEADQPAAE